MVLPKNLPTLQALASGNHMRPDNVFTTAALATAVMSCNTMPGEWPARSGHFPITIIIKVGPELEKEPTKHNFRAADWQEVREEMAIRLDGLEAGERVENWSGFYAWLCKLTATILQVIDATVPKVKLLPYAKRWLSQELAQH